MTEPLALLASSGNEQIDQITAGVITIFETHFPTRIGGYYFQGSCADQATTALSDIDLHVVFITQPSATEQQDFAMLRTALKHISPRPLDLSSSDEPSMRQADQLYFQPDWEPVFNAITLKGASVPVFGVDIREHIPLVPHDVYIRTYMHFPYVVLAGQRKYPAHLPYPLVFLDPMHEFFGYTGRLVRISHNIQVPSTKRVVHASGFIATALLALRTPIVVADKRTAITAYRQHINDRWADHLEAIHTYCRVQWDYQVPEAPADRAILRELCQHELAFENHFLAIYKDYLRHEQTADDAIAQQFAVERLQRIG
jgi:hypothetical protein